MKRLLAMFLVPASLALAAEEKPAAPSGDPMAGWAPPKVKNEAKDRREIQALLDAMDAAGKKGDLEAAAALVDFPVLMITDDSKGEAMGEAWDRDRWTEVMRPFYEKPMDMKIAHRPTIFVLTDSLASVDDVTTMTTGGKRTTSRNSMLVIRRDGKWLVKAMAEGGWGDMMAAHAQGAAGGSQGGTHGSGSAAGGQAPQGTGTGTQSDPQRTTK